LAKEDVIFRNSEFCLQISHFQFESRNFLRQLHDTILQDQVVEPPFFSASFGSLVVLPPLLPVMIVFLLLGDELPLLARRKDVSRSASSSSSSCSSSYAGRGDGRGAAPRRR